MAGSTPVRTFRRRGKYKNWGKWGPNDEIGTLNFTTAEDIVAATRLCRRAGDLARAQLDHLGPQAPRANIRRWPHHPVHTMLRTGTDAYSGVLDQRGIRAATTWCDAAAVRHAVGWARPHLL